MNTLTICLEDGVWFVHGGTAMERDMSAVGVAREAVAAIREKGYWCSYTSLEELEWAAAENQRIWASEGEEEASKWYETFRVAVSECGA